MDAALYYWLWRAAKGARAWILIDYVMLCRPVRMDGAWYCWLSHAAK
jgi:hypothetical protein